MNLPNRLTLIRIALVPLVLFFLLPPNFSSLPSLNLFLRTYGPLIALVLFVVASLTDYYDGKIARAQQLVTNMGKFLDPIADKVLVLSVFIALVQLGYLSAGWAILVLFREFVVSGLRLLAIEQNVIIAAGLLGKIKTASQMTAIIILMVYLSFLPLFPSSSLLSILYCISMLVLAFSMLMTVVSGIDYVWKNRFLLKNADSEKKL